MREIRLLRRHPGQRQAFFGAREPIKILPPVFSPYLAARKPPLSLGNAVVSCCGQASACPSLPGMKK
ncbi:hypothetical protein DWY99_05410 [[Clostridium] leptum]|uniref:Uncharacterized protein n=1 Tax=[Clostridium] leptum TaxID=1535 RepID=A0A412AYL8_9FIRM|nr:hypothetical protein DWY99_05410 [[Clostridium] leptum]